MNEPLLDDQAEWDRREKADAEKCKKHPVKRASFEALVTEIVKEYADEAEHQDGEFYWTNFSEDVEAVADFSQYLLYAVKERQGKA